MAKLVAVNMKRKDLEGVHGEVFDFALFSQQKKIKGLDADLLPLMKEKQEDSSGALQLEQLKEEQNSCSMQALRVIIAGTLHDRILNEDIAFKMVEEQMEVEEEEECASMEVEEEGGISQQYDMMLQVPPSKPTTMLWSGDNEETHS
ncbi:uncharacterized protein [Typha angustifolia]|uniref:uncharacterized protein isoform X1 n=1 Tax=Typha angustifolia TaxID=59011 RepID=UPI003C2B027C